MAERTEISHSGEFGLIDHLTKNNEIKNASTIVSVGDDAAVLIILVNRWLLQQICW